METKRPFRAGAINRLDQQLLKNNPVTWSTRIHLVLFYGFAFSIFLVITCFLAPDDPRNDSTIYNWIILLSIISLLSFIFWMIYLLRFNVFKRFGKWGSTDTVKTFLLYGSIILLVVSWPFIPPVVQSTRANMAYSSDELARDINSMNIKLCQLERDSIDTRFSKDTFHVKEAIKGSFRRDTGFDEDLENQNLNYYFIDTATLNDKLSVADSIKQINDSVYVVYDCPEYTFIGNFDIDRHSDTKSLQSMDLFRKVLQFQAPFDRGKVEKELAVLFSRYSQRHKKDVLVPTYDYTGRGEQTYRYRIEDKYDLYYVNNSINNIADKKYRWDDDTIGISWRVAYYITLILALLVLIYRHTTRRAFFLALLTAVVLSILTGLFMAMSFSSEGAFFTWVIIYFIIFSALAATLIKSSHRSMIPGIAVNLLVFMTPFVPLVITAAYYSSLRAKYSYTEYWDKYEYLFVNEKLHCLLSELGGFILLLALLTTLYQQAYRKWYALPEQ